MESKQITAAEFQSNCKQLEESENTWLRETEITWLLGEVTWLLCAL